MPICPRCNATIHTGAEDQCPACGYSMRRAEACFGDGLIEFTRVLDRAGALRHQERMELLHALEDLERNIPPVALCIYLTDDGRAEELRTHAHWILNHARIHHPSFGKREQSKAIEDAAFTEQLGSSPMPAPEEAKQPGLLKRMVQRMHTYLRNALHPLPPPVRREWMLVLVLDVQLEMACFSWGYMLDPYINPDNINSCIVRAKLHFRERTMVVALRKVMRDAAGQIAAASHKVNRRKHRRGSGTVKSLAAATLIAAATAGSLPAPAQEAATAAPAPETATATPSAPVAPPPPSEPGAPATYAAPPRWSDEDYRHLMAGELVNCYNMLRPAQPEEKAAAPATAGNPRDRQARRKPGKDAAESDTKVPARYADLYTKPTPGGLCDPQGLFSTPERADAEHLLRELNAHSRFRIYVSLFRTGQEVPQNLGITSLTTAVAQPCEYAVLIQYKTGAVPEIELGYQEINPDDATRHDWLSQVRDVSAAAGGGVEGLLAAIRRVHACVSPLESGFRTITPETAAQVPLIPIEFKENNEEKKVSAKEKMKLFLSDPSNLPVIFTVVGIPVAAALPLLFILWRRRSGRLYPCEPDLRLGSPYGAGVSRYVRYLEGTEARREKRLF